MPRIYSDWLQDATYDSNAAVAGIPNSFNNRSRVEFVDPGTPLSPDIRADYITNVVGDVDTEPLTLDAVVGETFFTVSADEDGGIFPGDTTYIARRGSDAIVVYCGSRHWSGPSEVPDPWDGYQIEDDAPSSSTVEGVVWHSINAHQYDEGIVGGSWFFNLYRSNLPDWAAIPGFGGPGEFDIQARLSGATLARQFTRGELADEFEITPLPGLGPVHLTPAQVSGPNGYFVIYAITVLDTPLEWEEPFGSNFNAKFGGNFSAFAPSSWVTYRLTPPRYRFYRDVDVTAADSAPRRKYPRDDGRGVGPARHYPPPTSRQKSIRRGGATYL